MRRSYREACGDWQVQYRGHLGKVGALAAKEILERHRRLAVLVIEREDVSHRG